MLKPGSPFTIDTETDPIRPLNPRFQVIRENYSGRSEHLLPALREALVHGGFHLAGGADAKPGLPPHAPRLLLLCCGDESMRLLLHLDPLLATEVLPLLGWMVPVATDLQPRMPPRWVLVANRCTDSSPPSTSLHTSISLMLRDWDWAAAFCVELPMISVPSIFAGGVL